MLFSHKKLYTKLKTLALLCVKGLVLKVKFY